MGLRHRSIRLRVGILIAVPVLCLIALYGFVASVTLGDALGQAHAESLRDQLLTPISNFQTQLDRERRLAVLSLASPGNSRTAYQLGAQEAATKQALTALKGALGSPAVQANASARERQLISALIGDATTLASIRAEVAAGTTTITQTLTAYTTVVSDAYLVLEAALDQQSNVPLVTQALDVITLDKVAQTTLEESDLLAGDVTRRQFPEADRVFFGQLAAIRAASLADTVPLLNPGYLKLLDSSVTPAVSSSLLDLERTVIATRWRHGPPGQIAAGQGAFQAYSTAIDRAIARAGTDIQSQSRRNVDDIVVELILAAGLGLLGTIASVGLSLLIGRGLVRQLRQLRQSALSLATEKLPTVIRQLRDGQAVDLTEYVAPPESATRDEIEQVQSAFNVVQQTAVQSAVDEARLRRGISDVFRNLAGRSQSLLHRQLTLLDGMERRATEPDELEDLFRIDHLTTRMRRHAEGLIILSGEAPARGWRQPVPLIDVLRAAVAEVEDYTRVRVLSRTRAAVAGHAVADVIHLIAELAENATVFSPPNTPVRIQGDVVGRGLAIEIEDRGLGISPERLAEINANLADPPQFDLSDSDRLGLFITGQLARRHEISVTLQPSVYGGTTAVVVIPTALVVNEDSFVTEPSLAVSGPAGQLPGRHAALTPPEHSLTTGNGHAGRVEETGPIVLPGRTDDDDEIPSGTLIPGSTLSEPLPRRRPFADRPITERIMLQPPSIGPADGGQDADRAPMTATDLAKLGLPTRVRQASLAPQLRENPADRGAVKPAAESFNSPEAARDTMSALQRGWQLGRAEASTELPDGVADPRHSDFDVFAKAQETTEPGSAPPDGDEKHETD